MSYIVIGYFTEKTKYEEEIQNLIASLKEFNLPMDIVGIPNQGSFQSNTQFKPYFIKQMLTRHFPKDVLYLDADAIVRQHPAIFDKVDFDVAVMLRDNIELISATMYFANNSKVMELLDRWIRGCHNNPKIWDQQVLQYLLQEKCGDLHLVIRQLPPTYCQIFDTMADAGNPVIEQFQASRRFRKDIDQNGR
jgi:hypothetical protein